MVLLQCSVHNCVHNNSNYCNLNQITIGGSNTYQPDGTNCENFINKSSALTNSISINTPYSNVNCNAEQCIYNKKLKCTANSIDISGYTSSTSEETSCATFQYNPN